MRGPCPGLGAALCAFGIEYGTFIARELATKVGENEDPWTLVDQVFKNPKGYLSSQTATKIGRTLQETWRVLPVERRKLLKLLSRFEITPGQAKMLYIEEAREGAGIACHDREILENPYLIYELTRLTVDPISVWTVDRGVFPEAVIREKHPLLEPSALDTGTDARRIRALTTHLLEKAADNGHALMPRRDVINQIRDLPLLPSCEVNRDVMGVAEVDFSPAILPIALDDGSPAYQLQRLSNMGSLIKDTIERRLKGKRHVINENWRALLDAHLQSPVTDEEEEKARIEKSTALRELAESRFSVLVGPAGTGKTTLLSVLCSQRDIAQGEVLLLAPTGKARVRMQQATSHLRLRGYTLAQFLGKCDRYEYETGRYKLSDRNPDDAPRTVIVDEASMLTEEMLAALLDALKGVHRLILVGDPGQLPPIGPGRPFVDIVNHVAPANVQHIFPRIGPGYAELTVYRRQSGERREDLQLAAWFRGVPLEPGEDEIFETIARDGASKHLRFVSWESPTELHQELINMLVEELELQGPEDLEGFDQKLGGTIWNGYSYFNTGASEAAEKWQILSPVRGLPHGVSTINREIHQKFRWRMLNLARERYRKIPRPMGGEEIVYGDKVINIRNHPRSGVYPKDGAEAYLANGEIGIAVGQFKGKNMRGLPWLLKVEFSSQPGFQYDFREADFSEEWEPTLELAYALTVHKSQGSQFELVILVLPHPCWLLSRELLYTALTRQRQRIAILHQGSRADLKKYASDLYSETATRLTNLFNAPRPIEIKDIDGQFFEDRLINRTRLGELVRSKSEVIIADRLADLGVQDTYEKALTIDGVTKYPDFTIEDDETGMVYYWEHCGMLGERDYRRRWEDKQRWYREHGILPYEEGGGERGVLIVTRDNEAGGISSQDIERIIKVLILGDAP